MNLGQLATAVGQRLGSNTSSESTKDGAAVRSFLTIRHDQLYRAYLWKDSIVEFETPANPNTVYVPTAHYMPTKSRVILPPIIANVLGARLGWRSLNVQRPMFFYRADYARFFKMGYTAEFALLSACVWEFDTVQSLGLINSNVADNGQIVTIDELASDEVTVTRNQYALNSGLQIMSTDRIDNFIKPATQGTASIATWNYQNLIPAGAVYDNGSDEYDVSEIVVQGQTYLIVWGPNDTYFQYGPNNGQYTQINNPGVGQQSIFTYAPGYSFAVFGIGQSQNTPVTAQLGINPSTSGTSIIALSASQTDAPKSQRIQLIGKPRTPVQQDDNLHVLGKRTVPPYVADSDVPGVAGLTGILFAFAYYDFKQRDEAGGSSDALTALNEAVGPLFLKQGIAGGFLGKLIEEEVVQAASNTRIIPADGFGGECGYHFPDKCNPYNY